MDSLIDVNCVHFRLISASNCNLADLAIDSVHVCHNYYNRLFLALIDYGVLLF